ncbi:MAG TPA: lipocalin-like domain-containing protein [Blastocatellia bacterium]|nr:lipocalin-like domain-containing protein [Blastocatellia bacterium]
MSNPFVGSWKLLSAVYERDGRTAYPFGREPVGLLIYDDVGNMAVQIMRLNRDDAPRAKTSEGDRAEKRASFEGYLAYFGGYEINEAEKTVSHYVRGSTLPHWVGSVQKRAYEFSGNWLTLSAPATSDKSGAEAVLVWERIERKNNES